MARMLLVRHGESTWNAAGRWQGWADPPLSELGEQQAVEATKRLAELGITALTSSDLVRARRTAEIMAERLGVELIEADSALREYDVGEWCGLTRPEIEDRWPGLLAQWDVGQLAATPGGETRQAFVARAMTALARLAVTPRLGDRAVVVTHGGLVRAVQRHLGAGTDRIPNLGGRWFERTADGEFVGGELEPLIGEDVRTVSPSA